MAADDDGGTVLRPAGVRLDGGGIAKGLAADLAAARLRDLPCFAVDCCGDLRIGGSAALPRRVVVEHPIRPGPAAELEVVAGAVATSGIGRRSWWRSARRPGHHLIDPAEGEPAYTGIVQVTAPEATAFEAEVLAKAALLSGPERALPVLRHGGMLVLDDGTVVRAPAHGLPIAA